MCEEKRRVIENGAEEIETETENMCFKKAF